MREPCLEGGLSDGDTPPPPGSQPLPGAPLVDLMGQNLAQWADHVQEVASHMRSPPLGATECPTSDIVGMLNRLEGMTRVPYCRHCFGVRQWCRCSVTPHQAPGPTMALWTPPIMSCVAMASSTETTASDSTIGVMPLTPGLPPLEPMDTSSYPTTEELLRMAGVGRGARGRTPLWTPTVPSPRQPGPRMPHPQVPTPGRQEATALTPYQHQVFPPPAPAPGRTSPPVCLRARNRRGRLTKKQDLEEGHRLEVPEMDNELRDPPPEDHGSAAVGL